MKDKSIVQFRSWAKSDKKTKFAWKHDTHEKNHSFCGHGQGVENLKSMTLMESNIGRWELGTTKMF